MPFNILTCPNYTTPTNPPTTTKKKYEIRIKTK